MTDVVSRDEQLASVTWALDRMVELRKAGEAAWFRVTWAVYSGRRVFRLEIRRTGGAIERPVWPLPLGKNMVEETRPEERDDGSGGTSQPLDPEFVAAFRREMAIEVAAMKKEAADAASETEPSAFVVLCPDCAPLNVEELTVGLLMSACVQCGKPGNSFSGLAKYHRRDAERAKR